MNPIEIILTVFFFMFLIVDFSADFSTTQLMINSNAEKEHSDSLEG